MSSREQNRAWAMTMAVAAVLAYTTGCTDNNSSSTAESTQTTAAISELESESTTTDSEHSESTVATPLSDSEQRVDYDDDDKTSTYDTFDAEITLSGTTADVTGNTNAVSVSDRTVTIQNGGTYRITGTWKDGQLRVTGSEKVKLYFDSVSITNSNGAALSCENEKRTILSLAANTENSLSDGANSNATTDGETAALFTEDKLTINGSGALTVTGNAANGIVCRDDLKIIDGTISVTAANNGMKGKDSIGIYGGTITIDAQNDGLKTTKADDPEQGWIAISGGTLNITAKGDGIQAETDCYIDGGTLNVTTTGEIAVSTSDDQPFGGGGFGGGFDNRQSPFDRQTPPQGGNRPDGAAPMEKPDDATGSQPAETAPAVTTTTTTTNTETTTDTNTTTTAAEDASSKGIKAGNTLTITGGTIQANTTDHCMHSGGAFTCSGGTLELSSSMDIGEHPGCNRGETYILTNADSVRMYKNDRFIKEYDKSGSPYQNLSHGPIIIDDFIGDAIEKQEHMKPAQAAGVKYILNATARYGLSNLPKSVYVTALKLVLFYHMKPSEAVGLYNRYIGDWGGASTSYRFDAVEDGAVVASVKKDAMHEIHLAAEADHMLLTEKQSYDVAAVRIRAEDEHGNVLSFCNDAVTLETEGAIELIGPDLSSLQGGMGGTFVRTTGEEGKGVLIIKMSQAKEQRLFFEIKKQEGERI